ncbi:uncharacterized protein LOC131893406 [Tigriopus californicus]|uniref:uncharacterized protein LOC131893406 n=1 Tax=Tigriopus californicus TaxID=6832 RepID=UPI0027DA97F8|nr:uncharacterized protein LOC131893406 [Tigriopus californicus]|eukprot:TCALIF_08678-PA protein Name:"Protein of unknown function" AED:0.11 eAED:0.11 QI:0/1/0/1/1/1/2/0/114
MVKAKQKRKSTVCYGDICSNMSTSYKVFLHVEGEEDDIQRFIAFKSFVCVQKKLKVMYPSWLKDETFEVTWKVDVNDMVNIANDVDLILALTEMSLPPYHIHIMTRVVQSKRAK